MFAYIDPGTGLLLWQAIVSAVVGAFFYVKKTRQWMVNSVRRIFRPKRNSAVDPVVQPSETSVKS